MATELSVEDESSKELHLSNSEVPRLIRQAVTAARDQDSATLVARAEELQSQGWHNSNPILTDALTRALTCFPELTPNTAAALTARISERFADSISIPPTIMEAVIREAAGEDRAAEDVPPNVTGIYSLMIVGQLIHEGSMRLDDAFPLTKTERTTAGPNTSADPPSGSAT